MFKLHERLRKDTIEIGRLNLSLLLLMNDRTLPWLILVPQRENVKEIDELTTPDRILLMEEITSSSKAIKRLYSPHRINVGALGNIVPQLHIHVIGRFDNDRAWPGPVWGSSSPGQPYRKDELKDACMMLRGALTGTIE